MQVLTGFAPHDRIVDTGGTVDQVERRVPALGGDTQLLLVRALVGDPAGVDGVHQDPVGLVQLAGGRTRHHVERGLGHVGVRVTRALVPPRELALHRRHVDHMSSPGRRRPGRGRHRRPQPGDQQERRDRVAQLHFEQLERVDLVDGLGPRVGALQVGQQATGVDGCAGEVGVERCVSGLEGERGEAGRGVGCAGAVERLAVVGRDGLAGQRAGDGGRVGLGDPVEAHHLGQLAVTRQRFAFGCYERRIGAGRAPYGLAGVVDQDVERSGRGYVVGECDDLRGVAQVDADDLEPVDPLGGVFERGESAYGVVREPRGDREVRAVAEQPQRDVHADLRAATGEQRPAPGEVGALVALGVRQGGTARAEPVVERVDEGVVVLADVAAAGVDQLAGEGAGASRGQQDALGLVVDAHRRPGGRGLGDRAVVSELLGPLRRPPVALERLVHV